VSDIGTTELILLALSAQAFILLIFFIAYARRLSRKAKDAERHFQETIKELTLRHRNDKEP
jgi:hypothetical protein